MKFEVTLMFERRQTIEVEADNAEDARRIVEDGEFTDEQITDTDDAFIEITGVVALTPHDTETT